MNLSRIIMINCKHMQIFWQTKKYILGITALALLPPKGSSTFAFMAGSYFYSYCVGWVPLQMPPAPPSSGETPQGLHHALYRSPQLMLFRHHAVLPELTRPIHVQMCRYLHAKVYSTAHVVHCIQVYTCLQSVQYSTRATLYTGILACKVYSTAHVLHCIQVYLPAKYTEQETCYTVYRYICMQSRQNRKRATLQHVPLKLVSRV